MEKIKIAQIGMSETAHAAHIMNCVLNMPETFEILGVADVDFHELPPNSVFLRPDFLKIPKMSVEEIFRLPLDAIIIDCDEDLQTKYALMAAEHKLHIQFEKPGSESDEDFDKLIDVVEKNNTVFHVSYMYRYNPAVMYAIEKIKNGDIGEIISIEGQMNIWHNDRTRRRYSKYPGGVMYYLGCHMTDIIFRVLGQPLDVSPFNASTGLNGVESPDFGLAVLRYKNGASIAKVNGTEIGGAPMRRSIIFCGSKGTLEIRPIERPSGNGFDTSEIYETYLGDGNVYHKIFPPHERYTRMMSDFAKMVRGEIKNPYSYEYERQLHKLILKTCGYKF